MAFEKEYDMPEPLTDSPCIHLRSKAIYVSGSFRPIQPDEEGSDYCWCNKTQHLIGPDDQGVSRQECTLAGRECYRKTR